MIKPFVPNLFVPIATLGGKPRKINVGIVIKLPPPTSVPNEAVIRPMKKMITRLEIFMIESYPTIKPRRYRDEAYGA